MQNNDDKSDVDNESDVEVDGIDMENDDLAENEDSFGDDDDENSKVFSAKDLDEGAAVDLEYREAQEIEEARRERSELLNASKSVPVNQNHEQGSVLSAKERLEYLIGQSDVFAQFLAGSVAANSKKGRKGESRGKSGRMTEEEEDALLLKSAQSKRHTVVRLAQQPSCLAPQCKMHNYQLEGLNWMIKLHDHGINGILADEMGLGKTLQTIALLAYLRESRGVRGPHLVIVPKSVVGNWIREFKKWCPPIKAIRMGGTKEERQVFIKKDYPPDPETGKRKFDVLVTSYEGFLKEKGRLGKIEWKYLIIDEAHRIKNENSSLSLGVRTVTAQFRLLITGTPLQNNLRELWALLNFLMPDIFGDAEQFDQWFSLADESGKENVIKKLHTVLRPFMLRRVKKDVATSLPPKKETKLYIGLTALQQKWYVTCLQKDAHELNKLGGPDKYRLLNVLMQLRKVCNHPYLFDGAEQGPPYTDGPHIWENSGKMQLLHKLLSKLQAKDSKVLIFSQMTRMLDILEDYFRYVGYEYCRIDGNTSGTDREDQMDQFNAEGSSKFAFLLSTRAGGLGITLTAADIVIIWDSDWNPQVDLQAMDRAHRIGQTKPVQVFRFITEGSVEEKIIERAERKLFLDAAVIQQGRLAEQNSSLEKDELMKMVRFGADQILSGKGGSYTDEDIDALIAKGEEKTTAMQAKLETDAKHSLADFSLLGDGDTGTDTFSFGGKNYRDSGGKVTNFINLPQRQRKRNYDLSANQAVTETISKKSDTGSKKKRKGPALHDFQLFDLDRMNEILEKERSLTKKKNAELNKIEAIRREALFAPKFGSGVAPGRSKEELTKYAEMKEIELSHLELNEEDNQVRKDILAEGFPDWNRKDFKSFCTALEKYGRYDFNSIYNDVKSETGKDRYDVQRYFVAFWINYQRVSEWQKIIEKVERGEKKILRLRQIRDSIQEKMERHLEDVFGDDFGELGIEENKNPSSQSIDEMISDSWPQMKINYGLGARGKGYQEEEDAFLVCMMYRHGYGAAERIRMEIRRSWHFRCDWFFKSRPAIEIQKRCDVLVRIIERENEEIRKKADEEFVAILPKKGDVK